MWLIWVALQSPKIESFNLPSTYEFYDENKNRMNYFITNISLDSLDKFVCKLNQAYLDSLAHDTIAYYCFYKKTSKLSQRYLEVNPDFYFENSHRFRRVVYTYRNHPGYVRRRLYKGIFRTSYKFERVYCQNQLQ